MSSTSGNRPILFAHRGSPATPREQNTLPAFARALALGAGGLESDVGLTADDVPVLIHPSLLRRGPNVATMRRAELPPDIPTLDDLYRQCGTSFHLSLDMAQPRAAEAVVQTATTWGALDRLWLTYWRIDTMRAWRRRWPDLHLVYATIPLLPARPGGTIDRLAHLRVDALNVFHGFLFRRTVHAAHERGLLVFAWGVKRRAALHRALNRGVDGVFTDALEDLP